MAAPAGKVCIAARISPRAKQILKREAAAQQRSLQFLLEKILADHAETLAAARRASAED
jgi:predicted HicB family RNase H-like nuclease